MISLRISNLLDGRQGPLLRLSLQTQKVEGKFERKQVVESKQLRIRPVYIFFWGNSTGSQPHTAIFTSNMMNS